MKKVIVFTTQSCGPCKIYKAQTIEPMIQEGYNVEVLDAAEVPDLARQYAVRAVPSTFILEDEKIVDSFVGMKKKDEVLKLMQ